MDGLHLLFDFLVGTMFRIVVRLVISIVFFSLFFVSPVSPLSRLSVLSKGIVHQLDESNFERETRASSGQRRGHWLVLFAASASASASADIDDDYDKVLHDLAGVLSNDTMDDTADDTMDGGGTKNKRTDHSIDRTAHPNHPAIHVARVNILTNPKLSQRFEIRFLPTLLYFANGRMYTYRGPMTSTTDSSGGSDGGAVDAMYTYVTTRYRTMDGSIVPSPPTFLDEVIERIRILWNRGNHFRIVLLEDLDHIRRYRKNAAALLLVLGGIGGVILTVILWSVVRSKERRATMDKTKDE
jgi:hypothetical protein